MSITFEEKHPTMAKVPVGNRLLRWMYNEGWGYILGLVFIVIAGFFLRLWNLTILDPYTDEYPHLLAAKDLLEGSIAEYDRAMLVTYMVMLFYKLGEPYNFYEYLYWGRMPGIIFGTLTAIPIYILAKRISKPVAIISATLWVTSPWTIGVSRTVREYAYYPFILLVILIVFIKLVEMLIKYDRKNNLKIAASLLIVILFQYYAFFIDNLSTLRFSTILLGGTLIHYIIMKRKRIKDLFDVPSFRYILLIVISVLLFIIIFKTNSTPHITMTNISYSNYFISWYLFPNGSPMHWWHGSDFQYTVILLLIIGFISASAKRDKDYFLFFIIFSTIAIFFMFFFDRYFRPRYVFYALPFFTILVAVSLNSLIFLFMHINKNRINIFLFFVIGLPFLLFKPANTIYPLFSHEHGYVKTTNEYHDKIYDTLLFIKNEMNDDDVFIGTITKHALKLFTNIEKERLFQYKSNAPDRFDLVREVIVSNNDGIMALDTRRNQHFSEGFPTQGSFIIDKKQVDLIRNMDGFQVYRWGER